jgi:hypothetical protein
MKFDGQMFEKSISPLAIKYQKWRFQCLISMNELYFTLVLSLISSTYIYGFWNLVQQSKLPNHDII